MVIDVAMTETARLADYVLPAATQFEKPEATFFNLEFPHNTFHLRHPLLEPLPGTLAEPEIWARLVRALGVVDDADLRTAATRRRRGPRRLRAGVHHGGRRQPDCWPSAALRAVRDARTDAARRPCRAAALWGLAQKAAIAYPEAVRRAGHADGNALFDAILPSPSGSDLHRARVRGRLRSDQPRGSQDLPRHPRNARRDTRAARRQTAR